MKIKYNAEFNGYMKKNKRWTINLINIRDERNFPVAREGTLDLAQGARVWPLGNLLKGDLLEFDAKFKGLDTKFNRISLQYPQNLKKTNIKKTNNKFDSEERKALRTFFAIKEKNP